MGVKEIVSVERQNGLDTSHFVMQLDRFASQSELTISSYTVILQLLSMEDDVFFLFFFATSFNVTKSLIH